MKKYLSLFMIVLMAVAVISTTGVATAAKKDAPYQIYYTGKDMKWGGGQCNYHIAGADPATTASHTESSSRHMATMSMTAAQGETGYQAALVGVTWNWIGGITYDNYYQYSPKHVKVTVDATWNIEVSGGDANSQVVYFFEGQDPSYITGSGTYTLNGPATYISTINGISAHADETGTPVGWLHAVMYGTIAGTEFTADQHISGTVTIRSISIQFLDY